MIPVIDTKIGRLDRQILIHRSKGLFDAALVISKNPIVSLIDSYNVKIKACSNVHKFQYCVKSFGKPCQFKDTNSADNYQHVSAILSPVFIILYQIDQLVLKCQDTEWTLSTKFQTVESHTSVDIAGVNVKVDIRRMPVDGMYFKYFFYF